MHACVCVRTCVLAFVHVRDRVCASGGTSRPFHSARVVSLSRVLRRKRDAPSGVFTEMTQRQNFDVTSETDWTVFCYALH